MASFMEYSVTAESAVQVTVPSTRIAARIMDDAETMTLADFTGPNAKHFPECLAELTAEQLDELVRNEAHQILYWISGIAPG